MPKLIVLISGPISSGKSSLAQHLAGRYGASVLKTKQVIIELAGKKPGRAVAADRRALQRFGRQLDAKTSGGWVKQALSRHIAALEGAGEAIVVVDAARILGQIRSIRQAYGFAVKHVHLEASPAALAKRYAARRASGAGEPRTYREAARDPTESRVGSLRISADLVIDTERCTEDDVLAKAATFLGLAPRDYSRLVDVYVGGQYGSEGKGHIVSYVAREYGVLVRVGGPNAGHKVFTADGPVTHIQLPSGTLRTTARLIIAPGAVLNVQLLLDEIARCSVPAARLVIDSQATVIRQEDVAGERRLAKKIGSTKQGVGFATARRIRERGGAMKLAKDDKRLRPFIGSALEELEKAYRDGTKVLVEGTQGAGLSIIHGTYPYVTSRDTTVSGCLSEAGIPPSRVRKVVMVCRTYPIRVQNPPGGTSGPMGLELDWGQIARRSGVALSKLKRTERTSRTNKDRRVAEFDWALLRRAAALNGPTDIALTFADYLHRENEDARRFEQLNQDDIHFIEQVERVAAAPVSLISTRFDFRSIIDRRAW